MMRGGLILVGLALLASAGSLAAVGRHDGILDATPVEAFPAPGQGPAEVRTRIVVDGSPDAAHAILLDLVLRDPSVSRHGQGPDGTFVTAHLEDGRSKALVLVAVAGPAPAVGTVLVVDGQVETWLPDPPLGGGSPVVWLEAGDVHAPLVFTKA